MRSIISSVIFSSHLAPVSAPVSSFSAPVFAVPAFGFAGHSWGYKDCKTEFKV